MDYTAHQNAEDLHAIFSDAEKLKEYNLTAEKTKRIHEGTAAETFRMELPFEEIKAIVIGERDLIFNNFKGTTAPRFEHIGSTSIKGMPGTMIPDGIIMEETFPPRKEIIQALLDSGWKFSHVLLRASARDVWFLKKIQKDPLKDVTMIIHLTTTDDKYAELMIRMRDLCNSDTEAFEDYKQTKINAALAKKGTPYHGYKIAKAECKTLQKLREELMQ